MELNIFIDKLFVINISQYNMPCRRFPNLRNNNKYNIDYKKLPIVVYLCEKKIIEKCLSPPSRKKNFEFAPDVQVKNKLKPVHFPRKSKPKMFLKITARSDLNKKLVCNICNRGLEKKIMKNVSEEYTNLELLL